MRNKYNATTLIKTYGKCGNLQLAQQVFDAIPDKDIVSWTAIITAYARNGHGRRALQLFRDLESHGFLPDAFTYTAALDACSSTKDLAQGRAMHEKILKRNLDSSPAVNNALINMYFKCNCVEQGTKLFKNMKQRDAVSWNTIIAVNAQQGHLRKALELYKEMDLPRTPVTFVNGIAACGGMLDLEQGRMIHFDVRSRCLERNEIVASALVDFYGKCGRPDEAGEVFERIKGTSRSSHVWTSIMCVYTRAGRPERALEVYSEMVARVPTIYPDAVMVVAVLNACSALKMLEQGREIHRMVVHEYKSMLLEENVIVANSLINLYSKCGCVDEARRVFDRMKKRDIVSWNTILSAYAQAGNTPEAIRLFHRMELKPNTITFQIILSSCSQCRHLDLGRRIHSRIHKLGLLETDPKLATAAVEMYCECGAVDQAREILEKQRLSDSSAWTTTLAAYSQSKNNPQREVFDLHLQMQLHGVTSDAVTYVCLLTACSHAGAVERGRELFLAMADDDREISPVIEHYACLVDALARAGRLAEAEEVVSFISLEADAETHMGLLAACRIQDDVRRGRRILERVLQLNPSHAGALSLMYNMLTLQDSF